MIYYKLNSKERDFIKIALTEKNEKGNGELLMIGERVGNQL